MSIINTSKPANSLTNITRVSSGTTWASDTKTWAAETRTWGETISPMVMVSRQSNSITNTAKPS